MPKTLARGSACAALAAAAIAVVPVGAQSPQPTPTSCAGMSFTDPAGDQKVNVLPVSGGIADSIPRPQKAKDNVDLLGGFLRYAPDAAGKNVLTANMIVTDLQPGTEAGASALTFTFAWTQGEARRFVQGTLGADLNGTFGYGTIATNYTTEGETTGTIHPGKNGIVSIVVPVDKMEMANKTLTLTNASSANYYGAGGRGFFPENDAGPDDRSGKSFKVVPCAEAGQPTTPQPGDGSTPPPPAEGTPPPSSDQPGQPGAPTGPATLNLEVTAPKLSAKKLKRAKSLRFKLDAGERITDLTATLVKGSKKLASGGLAEVSGARMLELKRARGAKFKKGSYTLRLSGINSAGQAATSAVQVRVKK